MHRGCILPFTQSQLGWVLDPSLTFILTLKQVPAVMMGAPPSQSLWVGILAVMVGFPSTQQKCISDVVQAEAGVVRAAPSHPDGPPRESRPTAQQPPDQSASRASPLPVQPAKHRRALVKTAPPTPATHQPIRIQTWFAKESSSLSEPEKEKLEAMMEDAVKMVSSLLSVNRVVGPLLLSRDINKYCKFIWRNPSAVNYNRCGRAKNNYRSETCLDVRIPDDHLSGCYVYPEADSPHGTQLRPEGAGLPDTDFVLYLHVQNTDKCRSEPRVLAYAVHCQTDSSGRPLAGVAVICRDRLMGSTDSQQGAAQTVIHELFHTLGFSKHLFHTWRDCSSSSPGMCHNVFCAAGDAGCSPRGKVTHADASGQMRIYTPSVISALQKHLASPDPELGAPLENLDSSPGGGSSHWESRVLRGSIMAAMLGDSTTVRIDLVTLGALQDTGWYAVNVSGAQSLVWGESEGATFGSTSTCQDNSSSFFCSGSGFGCHHLHLHKGQCQTDQYLEGCRLYKPLKNGSECWKEENVRISAEEDWSGEIFGSDSRCFFSSLTRQSGFLLPSDSVTGRCYRHRCLGRNRYQIQVSGAEWLDCPAGGSTEVKGFRGSVSCPDRRLCLYPDVSPPSDYLNPLPASITRQADV
ncbi:ciliated left-right organizer metallopeptidase [Antennarius striatus]|uniref:ciliated left-right organizer metallopeptidase n=1 Tax=Antennarius striatus TaxID=241820 RepID=UPI0035B09260